MCAIDHRIHLASQDDLRADRAERVEGLRTRPLTAALFVALPATRRNIIADAITMHVAQCLFFRYILAVLADHHDQFALVIHLKDITTQLREYFGLGSSTFRNHDIVERPGDG